MDNAVIIALVDSIVTNERYFVKRNLLLLDYGHFKNARTGELVAQEQWICSEFLAGRIILSEKNLLYK